MTNKLVAFSMITLCSILACNDEQTSVTSPILIEKVVNPVSKAAASIDQYKKTKGYYENGSLITDFNCPDDKSFPPIDIKSWNQIPVVNGRLPTYEETKNGTAIHHYGEMENSNVKPYSMKLPRLAYRIDNLSKNEMVVVIQIVQTAKDTIVSYRYLSGGCGGSKFQNFHFLNDNEVKKVIER